MNRDIFYSVIFIMGLFSSCHTRKVAVSRVDSLARHNQITTDRSIITTHTVFDTIFHIPSHTITSAPQKVFVPFIIQDSAISLSVTYDSTGNLIAKATEKARILVAKVDQVIIKQNNIIAKVQDEVHLIKKVKATKSKGMNIVAIAGICVGLFLLIALLLRKYKLI